MLRFEVIVALDTAGGIGRAGDLPWPRLAGDLAHFRHVTTDPRGAPGENAVLMGRRTWASLPAKHRPLARRRNVVVSTTTPEVPPGVTVAPSLEAALAASADAPIRFVIGGAVLYAAALRHPGCAAIHCTRIDATFACDTFFPAWPEGFVRTHAEPVARDAGLAYVIERWERP